MIMNDTIKRLVLEAIKKQGSVMPLFSLGYAYSKVVIWIHQLEVDGYVAPDDFGVRKLTEKGKKELEELVSASKNFEILPLQNVKRPQVSVDEVFLP